eukprot:scaffold55094_cov57-Phaeocystis_antarctica.AAC.7
MEELAPQLLSELAHGKEGRADGRDPRLHLRGQRRRQRRRVFAVALLQACGELGVLSQVVRAFGGCTVRPGLQQDGRAATPPQHRCNLIDQHIYRGAPRRRSCRRLRVVVHHDVVPGPR